MFDRLIRLVRGEPAHRPYEHLADEDIVERYVAAQTRLEESWAGSGDAVVTCNHLMAEWERRHDELVSLEARAERLEEAQADG